MTILEILQLKKRLNNIYRRIKVIESPLAPFVCDYTINHEYLNLNSETNDILKELNAPIRSYTELERRMND